MINAKNIDKRYVVSSTHPDHRKYEKFLVTIALRLGIEVKDPEDVILDFKGSFSEQNREHNSNNYIGSLVVNGQKFTKTEVKICTPSDNQNAIRTLWPIFNDNLGNQHKKHVQNAFQYLERPQEHARINIWKIENLEISKSFRASGTPKCIKK